MMNDERSMIYDIWSMTNDEQFRTDNSHLLKRRTGGCRMHGRRTRRADRSYEIRWGERSTERDGKAERIAQGWKTWPQLMCCALASRNVGSFDLRTGQGLRSNEGIGNRIVTQARRWIKAEYLGQVEGQVTGGLVYYKLATNYIACWNYIQNRTIRKGS